MTITLGDVVIAIDSRWIAYAIWGVGTVVIYGTVARRGLRSWQAHRDERSRRELMERVARFLVALASLASLTLALFGEAGTGIRGLIIALALGAFTAAGAIELRENATSTPDPAVDATGDHLR